METKKKAESYNVSNWVPEVEKKWTEVIFEKIKAENFQN